MSQSNTRWSQVVKGSTKSDQEDHQAGHATLQSRDPPPNTSYADLSTPSAASPSISISTSARAIAKGHRDNVSQVLDRVSASTVHAGAGQPITSESESAFPSLQSANPHDPHDVDPVLAPLVDDSIAQAAIRDVPVEISKAAKSADIKQGATAANALAAAAESSASSSATHTTPSVKKSDLGRALEEIEPRNEEPSVTIETPEPVVPLTETTRGGTAVQLGVIEATQQNIPIRSSAGTAGAPHDKSVIDQATGGFVPGTQEHIEPESYATTTDQPEFTQDASETESAGETKQRAGPSVIEQATQGFVPGTQERILHAPGTSAPPPTPISQLGAPPASQGAEAQVPLLPETTAGKHADREAGWVPLDPESSTPHTRHAVTHVAHKAKQTVPTSAQEIKETAAQAVHKAKDVMPARESVSAAISTGASAAKSAADQVSTTLSDTAAQAKATVDSAYDSATSTASSAIDTIKSTLLSSTSAESSRAKPLSHAERAEVLLDQIKDSAATGPDAVRATLAAGSSSSLLVESGSIGGLTGPTPPAKDHPALAATRHGHKMSPEEAAEARADSLFAKFGGGGAHKQASEPQPSATSVSVSGGGTTAAQLVESTPTSASRADQILANYESAAQIGPDAVRAALAAGTTHYPHPSQLQDKPKDVPPAVAQRILEQARASIDQLTASGHSEVDLVASESSPSATSSAIDTTIGEGLDYAASFARGVRAGITQATRDIERDVYETIRKSEGELAIPTTRTAEQVEHVRVEASEAAQHRAEDALAPILAEGPVETIKHVADDVITKVESGLLSIAESVGLVRHETEE